MTIAGRPLRARTRLTLWYVLLLAGSLLALSALGLWATGQALYANADELLRSKAAAIQTEIEFERGRLVVELANEPEAQVAALTAGLDLVRVWDRNRRPVYQRGELPGLPPDDPALEALLADQRSHEQRTVSTQTGDRVRLYAEPVRSGDRLVGVLQVGRSEADVEAILARLRLVGAGGLLLALVVAWAGGSFLAARALAPVDRITRAAEQIGADDLSRRLALPLPDDELGRLAAAFDGMIARLDRAFRRQRQLTADASHELRTPLATIRSQAEVALSRPREPAYYARVLTSIREEAEHLGRLTERLLMLARADTGLELDQEPIDLDELVADAAARVAARARDHGVELSARIDPTPPVRGDATWLGQLLLNLLDNALDHTPPGGRVQLAVEPADDGVLLRVSDTGEGIHPEHLPHIFRRFYRTDPARGRAAGRAGLGLAICEWVARAHGGRLAVESAPGQGSTFSLWLPASGSGEPAGPDAAEPAPVRSAAH